ncbi:MAG: PepSY-associated TM helix domain-containing protein [Pseudomonadota bacterium]
MVEGSPEPGFRASMQWLHTWAGLCTGAVLFAVFWMGTLSVFDHEIDRWMMPATRLAPADLESVDSLARELQPLIGGSPQWLVLFPSRREPVARVGYRTQQGLPVVRQADPTTSALLPDAGTLGGSGFLYPFHYTLHLRFQSLGLWIVGLAGMAWLALCVSGVVIHRKIFADFFTFRAGNKPRRLILDLHNVAGVLGLPFHVAITLSGLVIFFTVYFSSAWEMAYRGDRQLFVQESYGIYARPRAGRPGPPLASLDAMVAEASRRWDGGKPQLLRVFHAGDANAYVEVRRSFVADRVTMPVDALYFDADSGAVLSSNTAKPLMNVHRFITGFHFIQFDHWSLRWLYFVLGLLGCALIATGFLFWLESRRRRHAQLGLAGVRFVDGMTVGSVGGIIGATLAFFVANKLLPPTASAWGLGRADLEVGAFYLVWLMAFVHAWMRPRVAWREQCLAIAALALAAVLLNWVTTDDPLWRSLRQRHLWPVAGMDLLLLAGAAAAGLIASGRWPARRMTPRQ